MKPGTAAESCIQGRFKRFNEALIARLSYLTIRNTLYKMIYDIKKPAKLTNDLNYREKGAIGAVAGGIATFFVHPLETVSVRKIGDVGRAAKFHHIDPWKHSFNGLGMNVLRACILNAIMIWPYEVMKEKMYGTFGDVFTNRVIALFCSASVGLGATFVIDNIRTRLMYTHSNPSLNRLNYRSATEALWKAYIHEGGWTFMAGMVPMFMKMYIYGAAVT